MNRAPREFWVGLAASALALGVLALLAQGIHSPRGAGMERGAFEAVLGERGPVLTRFVEAVTWLGSPSALLGLALALAVLGWPTARAVDRLAPLLTLSAATAANLGLKAWFLRPRPGAEFQPLVAEPMLSFPSGHSMISLCLYGFVSYLLWYRPGPGRPKALACAALWVLVGMVGLTRVYLAAHYPFDVLGGFAAGVPVLWAAIAAHRAARGN